MIVVPDAGPLIYLGGADQIELLRKLYDEVVVPKVVHDEVVVAGAGLSGARKVAAARWIRVEDVAPDTTLSAMLDRGEAAAIPLAERLGASLLIDDGAGRIVARGRGLHVVGTLGVLLSATVVQILLLGWYNLRVMRGKTEAQGRVVGDVRWGAP